MICGTHRKCSVSRIRSGERRTAWSYSEDSGSKCSADGTSARWLWINPVTEPDEPELRADLLIVADHHGPLGQRQHRQREQVRLRRLVHDHHVEMRAPGELLDRPVHRHDPHGHGLDRRLHRPLRVRLPGRRVPPGALADLAERCGPVGQRGASPVVQAGDTSSHAEATDQFAGHPPDLLAGQLHPPAQHRRIHTAHHRVEPCLRPPPRPGLQQTHEARLRRPTGAVHSHGRHAVDPVGPLRRRVGQPVPQLRVPLDVRSQTPSAGAPRPPRRPSPPDRPRPWSGAASGPSGPRLPHPRHHVIKIKDGRSAASRASISARRAASGASSS